MVLVIEDVKNGKMGVHCAARGYGVLRTTLKDRLSSEVEHGKNPRRLPHLTSQEDELVVLIVQKAKEQKGNKPEKFNEEGRTIASCKETDHIQSRVLNIKSWLLQWIN